MAFWQRSISPNLATTREFMSLGDFRKRFSKIFPLRVMIIITVTETAAFCRHSNTRSQSDAQ